MPRFPANRFVEFCGLATSLLTAILVVAVEDWLNFSFFTLTFWVVVPVGALITGCLAATGYIAALQLAAFMLGGFGSYLALTSKPFCDRCEKYLKTLSSLKKAFADQPVFESFATRLHSLSPPSAEYLHILKEPHHVEKPKPGTVALEWSLLGCPTCRDQLVMES